MLEGVIGYAGSIGTALWNEIEEDCSKVRLDLDGLLRSLTGSFQGYKLERRIDNLQMDMTGMEMSVVNAHLQVQHVEEETKEEFCRMQ